MFGCIGRIVVVCILAVLGAVGWFTRDRWLGPKVVPAPASATTDWKPVTDSAGQHVKAQLQALGTKGGKAYVNVKAQDLLAYVMSSFRGLLPASAKNVEARVAGDLLMVKGDVDIAEMGGSKVLGPLAGMLSNREPLELGGTLELIKPGLAQLRVKSIKVKELDIPSRIIPSIMGQLRKGPRPDGLAEDGVALMLPANIGDIRVKDGKITVYGAQP
jgi:hypothetical protein